MTCDVDPTTELKVGAGLWVAGDQLLGPLLVHPAVLAFASAPVMLTQSEGATRC
jgi:hypothetical protein